MTAVKGFITLVKVRKYIFFVKNHQPETNLLKQCRGNLPNYFNLEKVGSKNISSVNVVLICPLKVNKSNTALMRHFHPVNRLVVERNLWLILLTKILLYPNLVKHSSKNSKDSKSVLIFYLPLVVVELLAIL
jgi:hypothetical protein